MARSYMDPILVTQSHTSAVLSLSRHNTRALISVVLFSRHVNLSGPRHVLIPYGAKVLWCSIAASTVCYHQVCASPKLAKPIQIAVIEPHSNKKRPYQAQLFCLPHVHLMSQVNTVSLIIQHK
jgi:hypothetical protein